MDRKAQKIQQSIYNEAYLISHLNTTHLPGSTFLHCQSDSLLGLPHGEDAVTCVTSKLGIILVNNLMAFLDLLLAIFTK